MNNDYDEVYKILLAECDSLERENTRLRELLRQERSIHADTRRKLEKADHDRKRYAKRIRFEQGRHLILCREYHATMLEKEIINSCLNTLERRLFSEQSGTTEAGTAAEEGSQETGC